MNRRGIDILFKKQKTKKNKKKEKTIDKRNFI